MMKIAGVSAVKVGKPRTAKATKVARMPKQKMAKVKK
jgi:hypothetical protein